MAANGAFAPRFLKVLRYSIQMTARDTRKIRVLHIVDALGHGGMESLLYDVLTRMDRELFQFSICSVEEPGLPSEHQRFRQAGIATCVLDHAQGRMSTLWHTFRFLRRNRFHIVHIHDYGRHVVMAKIAAILARAPVLMSYAHAIPNGTWRSRLAQSMIDIFTWSNVAVSDKVKEALVASGAWQRKVVTVSNGIDLARFQCDRGSDALDPRTQLGYDPETRLVGIVARLVPSKRIDLLIRSAPFLIKDRPNIRFLIVGEGPARGDLVKLVNELDISQFVQFLGWRDDMARIYRALDVLAMTSESEGFGLVVAEAMASGSPIVAVRSTTDIETLNPQCALFVEAEPKSIAQGIARLLTDHRLAKTISSKARKRAENYFDINRTSGQLSELYIRALHQKQLS